MSDYYITRFIFQRALALVYLIGFLVVVHQFKPLLGEKGLLPVHQFIKYAHFSQFPSIFYFFPKDWAFILFGAIGVGLSLFALSGFSEKFGLLPSMLVWFLMWLLYLSFVNVGQVFYAFGWESMLLEAGFLTIFLGDAQTKVPVAIIYLLRFILFKDMFGAGLIKLRGDSCWRDLTCMAYHYETQPIPNPLSWYFHQTPLWFHKFEVLVNHFAELIVPFFYLLSKPVAALGGSFTIIFQSLLMLSGNFSFLNFLTIVLAIPTFSDNFLSKLVPITTPAYLNNFPTITLVVATILVILNLRPVFNMFSPYQVMNTSYDPLHLVGTYGAFGSITKQRYEIIIEGSNDQKEWREYEFFGKPGRVDQLPSQIAPYHLRLDWLMWFAAFSPQAQDPWFFNLMQKILEGDKDVLSLLKFNPFPKTPPKYLRARYFKYEFTNWQQRQKTNQFWDRTYIGEYFPVL